MKKILIGLSIFISLIFAFGIYSSYEVTKAFKIINEKIEKSFVNGDIIFQTSESSQCEAVRIATSSKFSHCGIIFIEDNKTYVYEAVQPVKKTLLSDWIKHGKESKYVVKRLKNHNSKLSKEKLSKMIIDAKRHIDKDYDLYFEWSDDKIYCSELVWKIYKNGANIELCDLKKLKEFNLNHPKVQEIMKQRYGNNIPYDEKVVAPSQLYESSLLVTIFDNY
jgi:hypothetical protein